RSTKRTEPEAASHFGVAPSDRNGNSHEVGALPHQSTIDSLRPNVVADSSRSASGRTPRYTAASPSTVTGTAAAPASPKPSDTPSPRSRRATSSEAAHARE